jgi:hypothetical protein
MRGRIGLLLIFEQALERLLDTIRRGQLRRRFVEIFNTAICGT